MYLDYADDNVLQARPFRVVVQQQLAILFRTAKRGRPHARIQGAQMVVQGVQILFGCVLCVLWLCLLWFFPNVFNENAAKIQFHFSL